MRNEGLEAVPQADMCFTVVYSSRERCLSESVQSKSECQL